MVPNRPSFGNQWPDGPPLASIRAWDYRARNRSVPWSVGMILKETILNEPSPSSSGHHAPGTVKLGFAEQPNSAHYGTRGGGR